MAQARRLAGDRYVNVLGAEAARSCLEVGLLDEVLMFVAPVMLGDGVRMFGATDSVEVALERLPGTTAHWYRVVGQTEGAGRRLRHERTGRWLDGEIAEGAVCDEAGVQDVVRLLRGDETRDLGRLKTDEFPTLRSPVARPTLVSLVRRHSRAGRSSTSRSSRTAASATSLATPRAVPARLARR